MGPGRHEHLHWHCVVGRLCHDTRNVRPCAVANKAQRRSKESGKRYMSILVKHRGPLSVTLVFETALQRRWVLLFREPIVLIASTYLAILYGTLYMFMSAFPIVFQRTRGWDEGTGGLAFLGSTIGSFFGLAYCALDNNGKKHWEEKHLPKRAYPRPSLELSRYRSECSALPGQVFLAYTGRQASSCLRASVSESSQSSSQS